MDNTGQSEHRSDTPRWFVTTHWTVVLHAQSGDSAQAQEALGKLCQTYWPSVHAYIRRWGRSPADAEDLTQHFFLKFIEKEQFRRADPHRGRFRTFLLTSVKNFLVNEWERACAQKRGGGLTPISLDGLPQESAPQVDIPVERTAEHAFEQAWALALLERVRSRLASSYADGGKRERFEILEQFLPGEETSLTYAEAARRLGAAEGTVKSDVHRLKLRYRDLLREEIAHTVSNPSEIDEELRHLITVLARPRN